MTEEFVLEDRIREIRDDGDGWDAYMCLFWCKMHGVPLTDEQVTDLYGVVLRKGGGLEAFLFAHNAPGLASDRIAALHGVVCERGEGEEAFRFARAVTGLDETQVAALYRVARRDGIRSEFIKDVPCFTAEDAERIDRQDREG